MPRQVQLDVTVHDGFKLTPKKLDLLTCDASDLLYKKVNLEVKKDIYLWHKGEKVGKEKKCSEYLRPGSNKIIKLTAVIITKSSIKSYDNTSVVICKIEFKKRGRFYLPIRFKPEDKIESLIRNLNLEQRRISSMHAGKKDKELNLEDLIVNTPFYKVFTFELCDVRVPTLEDEIKMMQKITYPPSDYGKEARERKEILKKNGTPICDHRDGDIGDDVTLYYPGFQKFIEDSNDTSIVLEREDYQFAKKMCTEMPKYFDDEKKRQDKFKEILSSEFKKSVNEEPRHREDVSIDPNCCVIVEVKNESGQGGGSDSYAQVIAYYIKSLDPCPKENSEEKNLEKNPDQCPAPAYLLELVGPHLFISGAVFGKYVFVDRLIDPVWLVPHHNEEATTRIARILKALKDAIREIQAYYENDTTIHYPRFPIFRSCDKGMIRYKKRMKRHIFKGTLTDNDGKKVDVIIKFTKRYCHEAHALMYKEECAPKLIHYEERVGGTEYTAVVIEYIDGIMHLDEYLKEYPDNKSEPEPFQDALKVLHDHGFCHGKLTSNNIFMEFKDGKDYINIVNYEWAGRIGEARYPFSADIPDGIEPGDLISKTWDRAQLDKFFDSTDSR